MYPQINKFIALLHEKGISSFLVTNAQFPDAIRYSYLKYLFSKVMCNLSIDFLRTLSPVTQLYLSIDASTKESLKKIDRPLFRDFWERFIDSLIALREKVLPENAITL